MCASGQKPQLLKSGTLIQCKTEKWCLSGLSSSSRASSSSTSFPQDPSSISSSPASLRSDEEVSANPRDPTKTKNQNKNKDNQEAAGNRFRDLPEWLKEFTDNLEDTVLPASANISRDSAIQSALRHTDHEAMLGATWPSVNETSPRSTHVTHLKKNVGTAAVHSAPSWEQLLRAKDKGWTLVTQTTKRNSEKSPIQVEALRKSLECLDQSES